MKHGKILHIVNDEKFVDSAYSWANKIIPGKCEFLVISEQSNLKYIQNAPVKIIYKKKLFSHSFFTLLKNYKAVIIHELDFIKIWFILFAPKKVKYIWVGLGADYYKYIFTRKELLLELTNKLFQRNTNSWRNKLKEIFYNSFIVKLSVNKFEYFAPVIEDDYYLLVKKSNWFKPHYIYFNYGSGIEKINHNLNSKSVSGNSILIGNSATYENNHLDFFDKIKNFSLDGFDIICPLSYGRNEYKDSILDKGNELFGSKFKEISDFLSFENYSALISNCSIVVMNHKRQQALGNINLMLAMGAKIYLREENPVYTYLNKSGYIVYSINDINGEKTFLEKMSIKNINNNRQIMKDNLSTIKFEKKIKSFYKKILSDNL